ncbi:MAG: lysophospholipid acyltransferase family protein [Pirellulales bacterium]
MSSFLCIASGAPATWQLFVVGALIAWILTIFAARTWKMHVKQVPLFLINYVFTRVWWGLKVEGRFPQKEPGVGYLVVANHRSSADPMLLQASVAAPLVWMIAKEYVESSIGWLLKIIGVIPVTRGGADRGSIKTAVAALRDGAWIGIFPEGRINTTTDPLLPVHAGVGMIAARSGAAVIPCWIEGAPYNDSIFGIFLLRAKVRVRIGEPIPTTQADNSSGETKTRDDYPRITDEIMRALLKLGRREDFIPLEVEKPAPRV